jgi:hypothetical protein
VHLVIFKKQAIKIINEITVSLDFHDCGLRSNKLIQQRLTLSPTSPNIFSTLKPRF